MPAPKPTLMEEFKDFIMKGNILQLAVAFILAVAFASVVSAFTDNILMALIASIFGKPNFDALTLAIGSGVIGYGTFLTATVNFLIVAGALFAVVKLVAKLERPKTIDLAEPAAPTEAQLLTEIRDLLAARTTARQ